MINRSLRFASLVLVLLAGGEALADSSASQLQWRSTRSGSSQVTQATPVKRVRPVRVHTTRVHTAQSRTAQAQQVASRPAAPPHTSPLVRDPQVMAVVWAEEDARADRSPTTRDHSVVVGRSKAYDPFDEDDRLARLPDDFDELFDEPAEESVPEDFQDPEEADSDAPFDGEADQAPVETPSAVADEIADETPDQETDSATDSETDAVPDWLSDEAPSETADETTDETSGRAPKEATEATEAIEQEVQRRRPPLDRFEAEDLFQNDAARALGSSDDDLMQELRESEEILLQPGENDRKPSRFEPADPYTLPPREQTAQEQAAQQESRQQDQRDSEYDCQQELDELANDQISAIDLDIQVEGNAGEDYPYECTVTAGTPEPRQWPEFVFQWNASALYHKPLYFEQVQLERYGHSWGPYVQPLMSGAHFFGTLPILPYKMGIRTPRECVYALGYYRPGSCAPYMIDPIPFTWRAAFFQGAAVTGTAFAIP